MNRNLVNIREIKKYIDLNPKIANILELKTIKGSDVIDNTAGILSKAKRMSVKFYNYKRYKKGSGGTNAHSFYKKFIPIHFVGYWK